MVASVDANCRKKGPHRVTVRNSKGSYPLTLTFKQTTVVHRLKDKAGLCHMAVVGNNEQATRITHKMGWEQSVICLPDNASARF